MILFEGAEFNQAPARVVIAHLKSIKRESIKTVPNNLIMKNDGQHLILQVLNGKKQEFPLRASFLKKLLNWYSVNQNVLFKFSLDSLTSICNDFFLSLKDVYVNVEIEDGQALTITSRYYSKISDLEILEKSVAVGLSKVSRNDYFMRAYTKELTKLEPKKGDYCGYSINIFNSETGFRSLSVQQYIFRYACSNGLMYPVEGKNEKRIHYKYPEGELLKFLGEQLVSAIEVREKVLSTLSKTYFISADQYKELVIAKLKPLFEKDEFTSLHAEIIGAITLFELINAITHKAKFVDISKRIFLESYAGELLKYKPFPVEIMLN